MKRFSRGLSIILAVVICLLVPSQPVMAETAVSHDQEVMNVLGILMSFTDQITEDKAFETQDELAEYCGSMALAVNGSGMTVFYEGAEETAAIRTRM